MNTRIIRKAVITGIVISGITLGSQVMAHGQYGQGMYGPYGGQQRMMGPGMGMMGPGMGMMGPGMGMMGPGMGMMGPGMGMMGPGMGNMGPGAMGPGTGGGPYLDRDLSADDVKGILKHRLSHQGNPRLRVGKVEAKDDDTVVAEIETVDGSLVERFEVDRHTGRMQQSR